MKRKSICFQGCREKADGASLSNETEKPSWSMAAVLRYRLSEGAVRRTRMVPRANVPRIRGVFLLPENRRKIV